MDDKIFQVELERARVYWDYYKSMFIVFSFTLIAAMIVATLIYNKGDISMVPTVGIILLLFLCIILLAALMSLSIWRHENKHLDELIRAQHEEIEAENPEGEPLV